MDGTKITTMVAGDANQDYWYEGSQGSHDDDLVDEAMTLVGEWYGPVKYSYIQDDGMSRGYDEFYANMIFYQSGNQSDALSGSGVEIDEVHDNQGNVTDQQTLKFSWYINNNGDIYLKYASGLPSCWMQVLASTVSVSVSRRAIIIKPSMVI